MFKKKTKLLTRTVLAQHLKKLPDWKTNPKATSMYKTFSFASHVEALVFIARITVYAEVQKHYPQIDFTFSQVKVTLTSKEEKGLTQKDFRLAKTIEDRFSG